MDNFYARYPVTSGSGGVTSLNGETGVVNLVAGANITITPVGQNITISSNDAAGQTTFIRTLTPTDISNGFITLPITPTAPTLVLLTVVGGPMQSYGTDYTVSTNQLSWTGLFLDGVLVSGDILIVEEY